MRRKLRDDRSQRIGLGEGSCVYEWSSKDLVPNVQYRRCRRDAMAMAVVMAMEEYIDREVQVRIAKKLATAESR